MSRVIGLETQIDWAPYPDAIGYDSVAGYIEPGFGPQAPTYCLGLNQPFPGVHDPGLPVEEGQVLYYLQRSHSLENQLDTWGFDSFGNERQGPISCGGTS